MSLHNYQHQSSRFAPIRITITSSLLTPVPPDDAAVMPNAASLPVITCLLQSYGRMATIVEALDESLGAFTPCCLDYVRTVGRSGCGRSSAVANMGIWQLCRGESGLLLGAGAIHLCTTIK